MKLTISGRNIQVTPAIKTHVSDKLERLGQHFDFIMENHVFLSVVKNPSVSHGHLAEATIHVHGAIVRVEASSDNLYTSIDALVEKMERSLTKHKTKLLHRAKSGRSARGESIRRTGEDLEGFAAEDDQDDELDNIFTTYDGEDPEDIKDLKAASTLSQASV
jgi:putative sigma-54 modulation protein